MGPGPVDQAQIEVNTRAPGLVSLEGQFPGPGSVDGW